MEALELSISMYKAQLDQVKLALDSSDDDENRSELAQLVSDLGELIKISEENLLEMKRKELLAQLGDLDEDVDEEAAGAEPVPEGGNQEIQEEVKAGDDKDDEIDFSSLEGVKCRAPHLNPGDQVLLMSQVVMSFLR